MLAKWLKGITLSIAAQRPNDTHAALHVFVYKKGFCYFDVVLIVAIAAV